MRISLRLKLTLLSLLLLLIPLIGFRFSAILQSSLMTSRQDALMFTARAVATTLGNRPDIFDRELIHSLDQSRDLYLFHLSNSIRLNGKTDDWQPELQQSEKFGAEHVLSSTRPYSSKSLTFKHLVGQRGKYLYALFLVVDDHVIYRHPHSIYPGKADHLQIGIEDRQGNFSRYLLATDKPGWVNGFLMEDDPENPLPRANEPKIQGVWTETKNGYSIEMRIPLSMIGKRIAFAIADVDDDRERKVQTVIGTANPDKIEDMGWLLAPSKRIESLLQSLDYPHARIRIIDENKIVRARFGSLRSEETAVKTPQDGLSYYLQWMNKQLAPVYRLFTEQFSTTFTPVQSQPKKLELQGIEDGLRGESSITHYRLPDAEIEVMAAISPLFNDDKIVGAVVVEQTTNSILALKNKMIEESLGLTVLAFFIVGLGLLLFATRISSRIRRLRNQAADSISSDGQITVIKPVKTKDEIGDLSRTLASMLSQLKEQNEYREKMADNIEHEMRTPLAGISASLKNLGKELREPTPQEKELMSWALSDVQRMESLLTDIRDATNLSEALQRDFPEEFDLAAALPLWLEHGIRPGYPDVEFLLQTPKEPVLFHGDPDRLRQMLEKLLDNAVSFHLANTPISLQLTADKQTIHLRICNQGPSVDQESMGQIFNSMVSIRTRKDKTPHLGLGLYVVRTIVEHHGGSIGIENMNGQEKGVCFVITFPK